MSENAFEEDKERPRMEELGRERKRKARDRHEKPREREIWCRRPRK